MCYFVRGIKRMSNATVKLPVYNTVWSAGCYATECHGDIHTANNEVFPV